MAIYHMSVKLVKRSAKSSVAAAAYRSGEKLVDERTGLVHDYSRRTGVDHSEIVTPEGCTWEPTREQLWSAVELKNKRADAQTAREFEVALPAEMSPTERQALAHDFARHLADRYHIAVDVAIHNPRGDERNFHAHLLTTTNRVEADGRLGNKVRELDQVAHDRSKADRNKPNEIEGLRGTWADLCNQALERAGRSERVDHRTLEAQGIDDRLPGVKMGPAVTAMEKRGEVSVRAEEARAVQAEYKAVVIDLAAARAEKERLLKERERESARTAREEQATFGLRLASGWTREAAEAVQTLERSLGRLVSQADILREMERCEREEVAPIRTALEAARKDERRLVTDIRNLETKIPAMEIRVRDGRQAQEQMDRYNRLAGWLRRRQDFPRYVQEGYKQTWQDFRRQAGHQIQSGRQAENELPATSATLDQMRQALPEVRQRIRELEAATVFKRLVALDEAQQRLKPQVVRTRTAGGQEATREVVREDTKPTRALLGVDILLHGLLRATQRADEREARAQAFYEEQERRRRQLEQERGWER